MPEGLQLVDENESGPVENSHKMLLQCFAAPVAASRVTISIRLGIRAANRGVLSLRLQREIFANIKSNEVV
jgi:hypothetical protein